MIAAPAHPVSLPLLAWPEIARLETERRALRKRIDALPPHAHRRIILEHQLIALTLQQLALETRVGRRL